jgi:hypothetical protein
MTRLRLTLLLGLLAVSGCGDDSPFAGDAKVPAGYKTYSTQGISFAYPADWRVDERTDADGAPAVEITPREQSKTPYGLVQLGVYPKRGDDFDSLADQRRVVLETTADAKLDSDEPVDIPNAEKALRAIGSAPPGRGNDPVEVKSDSLDVLRENGDVVVFTVASPQREGQTFDPGAIVQTFRLEK